LLQPEYQRDRRERNLRAPLRRAQGRHANTDKTAPAAKLAVAEKHMVWG